MKEFDCDLHLHGLYSGGVSKSMEIPVIGEQAKLKGLHLMASADILCKQWIEHAKKTLIEENGVFLEKESRTPFILGGEINDSSKVHHIFFLPDFNAVEELQKKLQQFGKLDGMGFGRPTLKLNAEQLAEKVHEAGGIIGPAHAFTPYYSVYAHFNSVKECYGSQGNRIKFIELGLSADSYFADLIEENHSFEFFTFSDAHSPWPHRIGREFTRIKMKKPSFEELVKALERKNERGTTLNVGLNPREGKYHCTACNSCYEKYSPQDAQRLKWRCPKCHGTIKKGVRHRILELASFTEEIHPEQRPQYLHIIPLAEIIKISLGVENINSQKVQSLWREFIDCFESEIKALIDEPVVELAEVNEEVTKKIESFRLGRVLYKSGGGGQYGQPVICDSMEEMERKKIELKEFLECNSSFKGQRTLNEF